MRWVTVREEISKAEFIPWVRGSMILVMIIMVNSIIFLTTIYR